MTSCIVMVHAGKISIIFINLQFTDQKEDMLYNNIFILQMNFLNK
jgi:hypothetical protein